MFRVCFVCTGNRARSPIAERSLQRHADDVSVEVASAGVLDLGPAPALPEAVKAANALALDLCDHQARSLKEVALADFDLVLGFEMAHVAAAVVEGGAQADKTFTLPEFLRLLAQAGHHYETRAAAVDAASDARRQGSWVPGEEIADPLGQRQQIFDEAARRIDALCRELATQLFGF